MRGALSFFFLGLLRLIGGRQEVGRQGRGVDGFCAFLTAALDTPLLALTVFRSASSAALALASFSPSLMEDAASPITAASHSHC